MPVIAASPRRGGESIHCGALAVGRVRESDANADDEDGDDSPLEEKTGHRTRRARHSGPEQNAAPSQHRYSSRAAGATTTNSDGRTSPWTQEAGGCNATATEEQNDKAASAAVPTSGESKMAAEAKPAAEEAGGCNATATEEQNDKAASAAVPTSGESKMCAACGELLAYPCELVPCGHRVCGACLPALDVCPGCECGIDDGRTCDLLDVALCRLPATDVLFRSRSQRSWWQRRNDGVRAVSDMAAQHEAARPRRSMVAAPEPALGPVSGPTAARTMCTDLMSSEAARRALREAAAEGLTLAASSGASGYRGVYPNGPAHAPFRVLVTEMPSRKQTTLGCFKTAEEAARCYARAMRVNDAVPESRAAATNLDIVVADGRDEHASVPPPAPRASKRQRGVCDEHASMPSPALRASERQRDVCDAERLEFNDALLAAEPRRRWSDEGGWRIALGPLYARKLLAHVRDPANCDARGRQRLGNGAALNGFTGYHTTHATKTGMRYSDDEQRRHTVLIPNELLDAACDTLPGLEALVNGGLRQLPEAVHDGHQITPLHAHILDQDSDTTRFTWHVDTNGEGPIGARWADRRVVYTMAIVLSDGSDTAFQIMGRDAVDFLDEPGSGFLFMSALWHRTERASSGTCKLVVFYGYLL